MENNCYIILLNGAGLFPAATRKKKDSGIATVQEVQGMDKRDFNDLKFIGLRFRDLSSNTASASPTEKSGA